MQSEDDTWQPSLSLIIELGFPLTLFSLPWHARLTVAALAWLLRRGGDAAMVAVIAECWWLQVLHEVQRWLAVTVQSRIAGFIGVDVFARINATWLVLVGQF